MTPTVKPIVLRLSPSVTIIHGDCRDCMPIEADAVITDPPYFRVVSDAWDRQWDTAEGFLDFIGDRCAAWHRDIKPNGSLYCFASPKMAARVECKIAERFNVLNSITWAKPGQSYAEKYGPENFRQFVPMCERIIFAEHYGSDGMAKGECGEMRGFVFEPLRSYLARERDMAGWTTRRVAEQYQKKTGSRTVTGMAGHWFEKVQWTLPTEENYNWLRNLFNKNGSEYLRREYEDLRREYEDLRRPFSVSSDVPYTDVWDFPSVSARESNHPCEKPLTMVEHIITASTKPGQTVRDDFMGSGTTGVACIRTGRKFIGIELDAGHFATARARLERELAQGLLDFGGGAVAPTQNTTGQAEPRFGGDSLEPIVGTEIQEDGK